jgi:hypothetical protein
MELWLNIFILLFGVWNITMSLVMNTKNFVSALIFKIVPFFGGLGLLYIGAKNAGVL